MNSQELSKSRANHLIEWLRKYARERINSRLIDERRCVPPYIMLDFGNQGLMGMQIPEQYGGLALNQHDFMRVMEQLAAIDTTLAAIVNLNNTLGIRPIMGYASQPLQNELLPILAKGRELSSFGMTEPAAGANIGAISTVAVPDAHGGWRIRGVKRWNTSAWAGMINVFVRLLDSNSKSLGLTGFVVRQGTPGLRLGQESLTMGLRGSMQNAIYFDDVPVSATHLLGELGKGIEPADDALFHARLGIGTSSVGGMKRCLQLMLRYASRRSVGTGRLLNNPVTLSTFSHLTAATIALETLLKQIATLLDVGHKLPAEVAVVSKIVGSDYIWESADSLVQMLGGRGYMETNIAPQIFRDARVLRIGEGPNESLKIFLGKSVVHTPHLNKFLSEHLNANKIAETLQEGAQKIESRCLKSTSCFTEDSSALAWAYFLIGEVAIFALLLAAVEKAYITDRSEQMQRSVTWAQLQFQHSLDKAMRGTLSESVWTDAETITDLVSGYIDSIDDIEQTLAGEDYELDEFLRCESSQNKSQSNFDAIAQLNNNGGTEKFINKIDSKHLESDFLYDLDSIRNLIKNKLASQLNRDTSSIKNNASFAGYGLDSMMAVDFIQSLEGYLNQPLEATLLWNFPTIESLAQYLVEYRKQTQELERENNGSFQKDELEKEEWSEGEI